MTCIYCGRTDVDSSQEASVGPWRPVVIPPNFATIHFTLDNMCIDCADVVEHFVRSGLKAWREALRNNGIGQMDLFEDADLPPIARFLNGRKDEKD